MEDLKALVEAVGTPIGFTAVLALAIWKFFRWAAPLGERLVMNQLEFTNKVAASQEKMSDSVQNLEAHMGDMSVAIKGLVSKVDVLSHNQTRQHV